MLQWSEQFETGQSLVDSQHRMLISYVNRLEVLAQNTNPDRGHVELFLHFIEFLETYILTHFRSEEACMHHLQCPIRGDNQKAHQSFLDYFQEFKQRLEAEGYRPEAVQELHNSCSRWIQQHILRIDVQLKPCLRRTASEAEELD